MSPVREKVINIIEALPYSINEEIFKRDTREIFQEITQRYVETYGIDDLSEDDRECIQELLGNVQIKEEE